MDNKYIEGSNLPVTDKDNLGNTYQTRTLENGSTHKVLKNFPTETFIQQLLIDRAADINFLNLKYYWILTYKNI
jgi:demethylmenaquinone methyltransferase/2-methoxy-6-polyprenyl-1,4-benzoquinol methylase